MFNTKYENLVSTVFQDECCLAFCDLSSSFSVSVPLGFQSTRLNIA